jgi:hypothetical protein
MSRTLAALVNLNHQGHYVHWGFIQMSVANLIVIALMLALFVLALVLPFPHGGSNRGAHAARPDARAFEEPAEGSEP